MNDIEKRIGPYTHLSDSELIDVARRAVATAITDKRKRIVLSVIGDRKCPPPMKFNMKKKNSYYMSFEIEDVAGAEAWAVDALRAGYRVSCNGRGVT